VILELYYNAFIGVSHSGTHYQVIFIFDRGHPVCVRKPRTTLREWIYEYRSGKLDAEDSPEHYHYWFIPPPNGKDMVTGTCRICFERKEFLNVFPENSNWVRLV
jgi:hypothetical protein